MDLDELQSVQSRERQTDSLQQLRATFYKDAAEFIQGLEAERSRAAERADDPWNSPEVGRLNDDIDTAEQTVEAIFEKRIGKIVKAASLSAADLPTESDGMTAEEQALFEALVADIEGARERVLDTLAGEGAARDDGDEGIVSVDASEAVDSGTEDRTEDEGGDRAEGAVEPEPSVSDGGAAIDIGRTTVRITDDVGPIFGVDEREYDLAAADVVTLPTDNAEPLIERGVAEQLE